MKIKKHIPQIIYLLLFLLCLAIVFLMGRLEAPEKPGSGAVPSASESLPEPSEASEEEESLADREPEKEEETIPGDFEKERGKPFDEAGKESEAEANIPESYVPPSIMVASDLHYISASTHDGGGAFLRMTASDDGKINHYSDVLIETLVREAISQKPSALVLTGDITHNGERENHQALAEKLRPAVQAGVPVLVIPGNHDIQNHNAATYFGEEKAQAEYLKTGQEFADIYDEFGYGQAFSRDEASLSYLYELDDTHWMLMLDTCQYDDYNRVNGRLKEETIKWAERYLTQAREQGIQVLPVGHHNLLSESRLYTTECTMDNHLQVIRFFEQYELSLYISGHLHAQRIKKHKAEPGVAEDAYGITEIVLPPYSIPPCQYGWLSWKEDGMMEFQTKKADVAAYAQMQGSTEENLLDFDRYGPELAKRILAEQAKKTITAIPDDLKEEMADIYGQMYYDYCAGNQMSRDSIYAARAYKLWERIGPDSRYKKEMGQMIEDVKQDQHCWKTENKNVDK